jgi:hypothetical protein
LSPKGLQIRSTIRSTKRVVLYDFDGFRRSLRACKSLKTLARVCHGRGRGFEPRRPRHTFLRTYGVFGTEVTDLHRCKKVQVLRALPPSYPITPNISMCCVRRSGAPLPTRYEQSNHGVLCLSLGWRHRLRVSVQRQSRRGMP